MLVSPHAGLLIFTPMPGPHFHPVLLGAGVGLHAVLYINLLSPCPCLIKTQTFPQDLYITTDILFTLPALCPVPVSEEKDERKDSKLTKKGESHQSLPPMALLPAVTPLTFLGGPRHMFIDSLWGKWPETTSSSTSLH